MHTCEVPILGEGGEVHENMNCAFPLNAITLILLSA